MRGMAAISARRAARSQGACFLVWADLFATRVHARMQAYWICSSQQAALKRTGFKDWSQHAQEGVKVGQVQQQCSHALMKSLCRRLARAHLDFWAAQTMAESHRMQRMKIAIYRLQHRGASSALSSWRFRVQEAKAIRSKMKRVLERWNNQALGQCFNTWAHVAVLTKRHRHVMRRVVLRLQNRLLSSALEAFKDERSEAKAKFCTRLQAFRFFCKVEQRLLKRMWELWREYLMRGCVLLHLGLKAQERVRQQRLCRSVSDWLLVVGREKARVAAVMEEKSRRMLSLVLLRTKCSLACDEGLVRSAFLSWQTSSLLTQEDADTARRLQASAAKVFRNHGRNTSMWVFREWSWAALCARLLRSRESTVVQRCRLLRLADAYDRWRSNSIACRKLLLIRTRRAKCQSMDVLSSWWLLSVKETWKRQGSLRMMTRWGCRLLHSVLDSWRARIDACRHVSVQRKRINQRTNVRLQGLKRVCTFEWHKITARSIRLKRQVGSRLSAMLADMTIHYWKFWRRQACLSRRCTAVLSKIKRDLSGCYLLRWRDERRLRRKHGNLGSGLWHLQSLKTARRVLDAWVMESATKKQRNLRQARARFRVLTSVMKHSISAWQQFVVIETRGKKHESKLSKYAAARRRRQLVAALNGWETLWRCSQLVLRKLKGVLLLSVCASFAAWLDFLQAERARNVLAVAERRFYKLLEQTFGSRGRRVQEKVLRELWRYARYKIVRRKKDRHFSSGRQEQVLRGSLVRWFSLAVAWNDKPAMLRARAWRLLDISQKCFFGSNPQRISSMLDAVDAWKKQVGRNRILRRLAARACVHKVQHMCAMVWRGWLGIWRRDLSQRKGIRRLISSSFFRLARQTVDTWCIRVADLKRLRLAISRMTSRAAVSRDKASASECFESLRVHAADEIRLRAASRRVVLQRLLRLAAAVLGEWSLQASRSLRRSGRALVARRWRQRRQTVDMARCLQLWQARRLKRCRVVAALRRQRLRDQGWLGSIWRAWWWQKEMQVLIGRSALFYHRSKTRWCRCGEMICASISYGVWVCGFEFRHQHSWVWDVSPPLASALGAYCLCRAWSMCIHERGIRCFTMGYVVNVSTQASNLTDLVPDPKHGRQV